MEADKKDTEPTENKNHNNLEIKGGKGQSDGEITEKNINKKKNKEEFAANTNITTINVSKEQKDLLLLENAGLKKDNELYKTKLLSLENELRNLKAENAKLQKENATSLQELIKKKTKMKRMKRQQIPQIIAEII